MAAEWLISALLIAICSPAFGHFETVRPVWTRIVRWLAYLGVTGLLGATVGRPGRCYGSSGCPCSARHSTSRGA
jgi:hypothetical protein